MEATRPGGSWSAPEPAGRLALHVAKDETQCARSTAHAPSSITTLTRYRLADRDGLRSEFPFGFGPSTHLPPRKLGLQSDASARWRRWITNGRAGEKCAGLRGCKGKQCRARRRMKGVYQGRAVSRRDENGDA